MIIFKTCRSCDTVKILEAFYFRKLNSPSRSSQCKKCCSIKRKNKGKKAREDNRLLYTHSARRSMEDVRYVFEKLNITVLSTFYKNNKTPLHIKCNLCRHEWRATFHHADTVGAGCPICNTGSCGLKYGVDKLTEICKNRPIECTSANYLGIAALHEWKCTVQNCKNIWLASPHNVGRGTGCPKCAKKFKGEQTEVYEFVRKMYPDAIQEARILKNKRFRADIYVPSLKKAIEYDGFEWHKGEIGIKAGTPERDARKDQEYNDAGIQLLRLDDREYRKYPEAVFIKIMDFLQIIS